MLMFLMKTWKRLWSGYICSEVAETSYMTAGEKQGI